MLLSYSGERVLTQEAYIHTYFPLVRVHVAADVLLFRPRPGMRLGAGGRAGRRVGGQLCMGGEGVVGRGGRG